MRRYSARAPRQKNSILYIYDVSVPLFKLGTGSQCTRCMLSGVFQSGFSKKRILSRRIYCVFLQGKPPCTRILIIRAGSNLQCGLPPEKLKTKLVLPQSVFPKARKRISRYCSREAQGKVLTYDS